MKSFNEKCYSKLREVPAGKVVTYGELARAVGKPGAARAVGNAMNKNPYAPRVPCHRVVGANGGMVGFASGVDKKIKMLRGEGVEVKKGNVDLGKFGFRFC
jgi:methylated-DNA-[protein]-cysteine S-methyltransferase